MPKLRSWSQAKNRKILFTGKRYGDIKPDEKYCAGSRLVAHNVFNGKACCPICMHDRSVNKDGTISLHGKKMERLVR